MTKRLTQEEFILKVNKAHGDIFDYSKTEYINSRTKIKILCKIHGEFSQTAAAHLLGAGCPKCAGEQRRIPKEIFLEKAKQIHGNDTYDYSLINYQGIKKKINIICKIHGNFSQKSENHLLGHGCPKCGRKTLESKHTKTTDRFKQEAILKHGDRYNYLKSHYIGTKKKIEIICKIHGSFWMIAQNHLKGSNCPKCVKHTVPQCCPRLESEFKRQANLVHNNKYYYDNVKYVNAHVYILITCKYHGIFKQKPCAHLLGAGCPKCSSFVSKPEIKWLNSLNIPNDIEHRNVTIAIPGKWFKVDGFDPETKTIYEFNGDFWHGNPNRFPLDQINKANKQTFGFLYQKTLNKKAALEAAGYTVISIWESEFKGSLKR